MSKYNYLGGYSPKRKSQDALDEEGNPNPEYNSYARGFGEKLGVFPEHMHDFGGYMSDQFRGDGGNNALAPIGRNTDTLNTKILNLEYVELGEKVEPLSNIVRFLQKI